MNLLNKYDDNIKLTPREVRCDYVGTFIWVRTGSTARAGANMTKKFGEFHGNLRDCQLLKDSSIIWIYLQGIRCAEWVMIRDARYGDAMSGGWSDQAIECQLIHFH
jgi:hypothetical protein